MDSTVWRIDVVLATRRTLLSDHGNGNTDTSSSSSASFSFARCFSHFFRRSLPPPLPVTISRVLVTTERCHLGTPSILDDRGPARPRRCHGTLVRYLRPDFSVLSFLVSPVVLSFVPTKGVYLALIDPTERRGKMPAVFLVSPVILVRMVGKRVFRGRDTLKRAPSVNQCFKTKRLAYIYIYIYYIYMYIYIDKLLKVYIYIYVRGGKHVWACAFTRVSVCLRA